MRVRLDTLQPNPFRDYRIDPIDEKHVEKLAQSITEHGFWSGVVARKRNSSIQIAAGHHRVDGAMKAGITEADIFVGDFDDAQMVRIYANENATQRGENVAAAKSGSVAGAIRFLAKEILLANHVLTLKQHGTRQGNIQSVNKGIGARIITEFLHDVPGVNQAMVSNELANLKDSGEYARIIQEVQQEIEQEGASKEIVDAARQAVVVAEKSTGSGSGEPTFDLQGTLQHLINDDHVRTFREMVTGVGVQPFLPVDRQKDVAKALVDLRSRLNEKSGKETKMTSEFIRENLMEMLTDEKRKSKELSRKEAERIRENDVMEKWQHYMKMFCRNARSTVYMGNKMAALIKENKDKSFPLSSEFRESMIVMKKIWDKLHMEIQP